MDQVIIVFCNVPDEETGRSMARLLVEQRLAACVNLHPGLESVYRWQGQVEEARETGLVIKTTASQYASLEQALRFAHPYEVPEIIAVPVSAGLPAYLEWVAAETRGSQHA